MGSRPDRLCSSAQSPKVICVSVVVAVILLLTLIIPYLVSLVEQKKWAASTVCLNRQRWFEQSESTSNHHCVSSTKELKQRLHLLTDISSALNAISVVHWLCYGSLWGVIRGNTLLTYDKDGDICTVDITPQQMFDVLSHLPGEVYITQNFSSFHVWREMAEVEITLFSHTELPNDNTNEFTIQRMGYDSNYVPKACVVEQFPERLIRLPLPTAKLDGSYFPVPHENFEIMMYTYPYNWHKIRKPEGCA